MKGYKTSKDYKRLKELLDAGNNVIILIDGEIAVSTKVAGMYYNPKAVYPGNISDKDFAEVCEFDKIEFLLPEI